jgi:CheY-like chemotaxis protein
LIDDDACVLRTLCRCLSKSFEVTGVQSAETALELLGSGARFDVIICDYQLDGSLSGIQFYETVKSDYPDQLGSVVIMSGGTASLADSALASSLCSRWLAKPFSLAELENVLQRLRPSLIARTARPSHSSPPL